MDAAMHKELITALEWYVDQGVTDTLLDEVMDRMAVVEKISPSVAMPVMSAAKNAKAAMDVPVFLGKSDDYEKAARLVGAVNTLEELHKLIADFDGVTLKKTATNMVFADGNPDARIMLIGDAPAADDDRLGKAFAGVEGQILDKMLACIGIDRGADNSDSGIYMSNILNWRPPGNRTPSSAEIEVSLPFIERHIQLVQPKIIVLCGGLTAKSLLGRSESISRLRKSWHDYTPQTKGVGIDGGASIPAIVIHPMSTLIKTPMQKKSAWMDMLMLQEKLASL